MRRIPIPNNNSPNEFGVELDKTLKDGSKALGVVRITDQPSPYNSEDTLINVEAWQVTPDGRPIAREQPSGGIPSRVGIRQMIVIVPRTEYTVEVAEKQIPIAAAALEQEAGEIPEAVSLPAPHVIDAPAPNPEQPTTT